MVETVQDTSCWAEAKKKNSGIKGDQPWSRRVSDTKRAKAIGFAERALKLATARCRLDGYQ